MDNDLVTKKANELIYKFQTAQYSGCVICSDDFFDKEVSAEECAEICCKETLEVLLIHGTPESVKFWEQLLEKIQSLQKIQSL